MADWSPRWSPLQWLRVVVLAVVLVTVLGLGHSFLTGEFGARGFDPAGTDATVVATIDGAGPSQLVAYSSDGTVTYRNRSLWIYHDVDPSPAGAQTVTYVGSHIVDESRCDAGSCMVNVVDRVNLSTGERERVYSRVDPTRGSSQLHDVDPVNESVLLVADIDHPDRVYMVNTTTGEEVWEWRVAEAFEPESGGDYPSDWTHINDVELLPDGRVMANLRNQDQVVFVEPGEGLQENWTLGTDDDHAVLYEQHNSDYIPESDGGPAVVVADSENNRVVEYQRRGGEWVRSWAWADERLQWPRDADRQPSGRTVVVDSHGARILSVDTNGSVAWSHPFPDGGYDVEVLDTPDESDGPSAVRGGLESRTPTAGETSLAYRVISLVPPLVLHSLLWALPTWTTAIDAVFVLLSGAVVGCWLVAEATVRVRSRLRAGAQTA